MPPLRRTLEGYTESNDSHTRISISGNQQPAQACSRRTISARVRDLGRLSVQSSARSVSPTASSAADDAQGKGPFGLTTVYEPSEGHPCIAHIIFVHGLGGGSEHTWSKNGVLWPRDLLPYEHPFRMTSIHSFGYDSNFRRSSILDIQDFANSLLHGLLHDPVVKDSKSSILLVAHSMGGLIIKKAYLLAKRLPHYSKLAERIGAMCFMATPHPGSSLAPVLDKVFRLSSGLKPYLEDLKANSETVQSINSEFPWISTNLLVYSFFETNRLSLGGLREVMIVPKEDAILGYPHEKTHFLYGDHRSICKYDSSSDHNFITMSQALAACLTELGCADTFPGSQAPLDDQDLEISARLSEHLGVFEPPADDLLLATTDRLPGTCQWLIAADEYQMWRDATSSTILWLRGPPGCGKSCISGYVIEKLQNLARIPCYYFFNYGDKAKTSMKNFLLSMAWQMASAYPDVGTKLVNICQRDQEISRTADYRVLQRKLWEGGIFQAKLESVVYWVIDAFDECESGQDLAKFLTRVQMKTRGKIRIFTTTRNAYNDYHLSLEQVTARDITPEDVQSDIEEYLNARKHEIPGANTNERETLRSLILEKSNGCFLWTTLVLQRLVNIVGVQARLRALEELPPGMSQLYSRIVQSMSEREKSISRTILTWVACAIRPLSTAELKTVVERVALDEIDDIGLVVSKYCNDLVFVDNGSKVRMRHASATAFLLRQDINCEADDTLTMHEDKSHATLAMACLDLLTGLEMKAKPKRKMVTSSTQKLSGLTDYACKALHQHVNKSRSLDADLTASLARFLQTNVLAWIEYLARQGDLETILQFAQVLRAFLRRKSRVELLLGEDVVVIDSWATDLVRLVSRFGRQILMYPESVLNIIPSFCPSNSTIHSKFAKGPGTAIAVSGLSSKDWDDCLCTAVLSTANSTTMHGMNLRERLHSLAASDESFCIGTSTGRIVTFNEDTCLEEYALEHGQPAILVKYAAYKPLLVSASRKQIRIWNLETREQEWEYSVAQKCLELAFTDDDNIVLVVLSNNTLLAMNLIDRVVEETCWTDMLDGSHRDLYRNASPQFVAFNTYLGLLAIAYRSRRLFVYDYERDSYQIFDHKDGLSEGITQTYATSIYSLAFSNLPDTSLLAVSYSSSDLVLFDTEAGTKNVSIPKSNYSHLVSSPDGRTLAGALRDGTIELYDFETLHKLYRIRSDGGAVSVMKFTANSTRLLVIRAGGHDCRVWAPETLYRREFGNDSIRSPSLGSGSQDGAFDENIPKISHITAIGCDDIGAFFFVGNDNFSVSVYDTKTGLSIATLFSHHDTVKILYLGVHGQRKILFSVDVAGRLMAHELSRDAQDWHPELLYTYHRPFGSIHHLLCSQDGSNVLVQYTEHATVVCAFGGRELATLSFNDTSPALSEVPCWVQHPTNPALLLRVTATRLNIYAWSTLESVAPHSHELIPTGNPDARSKMSAAMLLFSGGKAMVFTKSIHPPYGPRGPFTYLSYAASNLGSLEEEMITPTPRSAQICAAIDAVLGTYRERLVFLHKDGWVCSIKATGLHDGEIQGSRGIVHHFAPPADWLLASKMIMQVTRSGDTLFVVKGEVAVVKRGLERSADIQEKK